MKMNLNKILVLAALAALTSAAVASAEDQQTIIVRLPRFRDQQHFKAQLSSPGTKVITDFSKGDMVLEEFAVKVGPIANSSGRCGISVVNGAVVVPGRFCGGGCGRSCGYVSSFGYGGGCGYGYYGWYPAYASPWYGYGSVRYGQVYVQSRFAQPSEVGVFLGRTVGAD